VGKDEHGPIFDFVHRAPFPGGKVYLDAGVQECECSGIMRHTGDMTNLLVSKGYRPGADLLFRPDPHGKHHEESWKHRLPGALDFMCHAP
jgi:predicted alpha/beta superfamily hydrolase